MITGITFCLIVTMANLVVGAFVGLTGVAGFLLPITYTSLLGLGTTEGLALSFGALILSGHAMHEQEAAFLIRPYWKWG